MRQGARSYELFTRTTTEESKSFCAHLGLYQSSELNAVTCWLLLRMAWGLFWLPPRMAQDSF